MGATTFSTTSLGKTAREAFTAAREQALHECGHGGYTGTIAEKHSYEEIKVGSGVDPHAHANALLDADDIRIVEKDGPAGCIALRGNEFLFFGWASTQCECNEARCIFSGVTTVVRAAPAPHSFVSR